MKTLKGKIIKGIGGFYYIEPSDSNFIDNENIQLIECKPRGKFRHKGNKPIIGDYVILSLENEDWVIEEILERKNKLVRPPVSNVDIAFLCIPIKEPNPDLNLLDKLIINCLVNNIEPVICLTKSDLDPERVESIKNIYSNAGFKVITLSIYEEDDFEILENLLKGKTAFMAGPSGAGKSTLANRLSSQKMETGFLSKKLGRGKHTTRHVELLKTHNGGFLLDTPGFSSLDFEENIEAEQLKDYYPEFDTIICRFSNCNHIKEPGCEVRNNVRDHKIDVDRYKRYKTFFNYLKERNAY